MGRGSRKSRCPPWPRDQSPTRVTAAILTFWPSLPAACLYILYAMLARFIKPPWIKDRQSEKGSFSLLADNLKIRTELVLYNSGGKRWLANWSSCLQPTPASPIIMGSKFKALATGTYSWRLRGPGATWFPFVTFQAGKVNGGSRLMTMLTTCSDSLNVHGHKTHLTPWLNNRNLNLSCACKSRIPTVYKLDLGNASCRNWGCLA